MPSKSAKRRQAKQNKKLAQVNQSNEVKSIEEQIKLIENESQKKIQGLLQEAKQKKDQIIQEEQKQELQNVNNKAKTVAQMIKDNHFDRRLPSKKHLIDNGIFMQMWSKYIDDPCSRLLNKYFYTVIIMQPAIHFCDKCQTATRHIYLDSDFPSDYYEKPEVEYDSDGNEKEDPEFKHEYDFIPSYEATKFHCLECLFKTPEILTSGGLPVQQFL